MKERKVIIGDYIDPDTGIRVVEDDRGNYHCMMIAMPPSNDSEKQRLIRIMEALRAENNWLWGVLMAAIIDRKKKGAPTAMDELEQKIKERQRA